MNISGTYARRPTTILAAGQTPTIPGKRTPAMPTQQEHYPFCPCPTCFTIREKAHTEHWASLNLHERIQETLNAKIEGDNGRMPEKGMFNCRDIQDLLAENIRLTAERNTHQ